jgi:microcin C transport system substrate-binding protein
MSQWFYGCSPARPRDILRYASLRARRTPVAWLGIIGVATLACCVIIANPARAQHGYSPVHELKYGPDFPHFDYANPSAPKGGQLRLGATGTFDSLNPLLYPGRVPELVRDLVFDTLLVRSGDEPAAYYGLLAESVSVSDDRRRVSFTLREEARWRDGEPVTADDVAFTFKTLLDQGPPFYRQALRHYRVTVTGPRAVTFEARNAAKRDMVRILGRLPIQPQHFWAERDLGDHGLTPPLGSGPYGVDKVDPGSSLTLARNPDYWGRDLPVNLGRFNFDRISIAYYRDDSVALEAFRAGDFDLRKESAAARWARGYEGTALRSGDIKRDVIATQTAGEITTLVFNLRRKPFDDRRIRQAINLAYDFAWTNDKLMYGLREPVDSFFGDTEFAARGAASEAERELLTPVADALPARLFKTPDPGLRADTNSRRAVFAKADRLLREAGYTVEDGQRVAASGGEPLRINLLNYNPSLIRVLGPFAQNLKQLGIELRYPMVDPATGTRRTLDHDFDMTVLKWSPRAVPGNAESLLWGSALAERKGTYALAGAKDPALDAALEAMVTARDMGRLKTAARAFDRVLRWQHYVVGLWRNNDIWLAYWDKFGRPAHAPRYAPSFVDRWWQKPERQQSRAGLLAR